MRPVFADTSYYLALTSVDDSFHEKAVELSESILGKIYVTEYVLVELGSALSRGRERSVLLEIIKDVKTNPNMVFVPASYELFINGIELFGNRPDKNWSLVDCISFIVMKQKRLREAQTADHHFEQAGFVAFLK